MYVVYLFYAWRAKLCKFIFKYVFHKAEECRMLLCYCVATAATLHAQQYYVRIFTADNGRKKQSQQGFYSAGCWDELADSFSDLSGGYFPFLRNSSVSG